MFPCDSVLMWRCTYLTVSTCSAGQPLWQCNHVMAYPRDSVLMWMQLCTHTRVYPCDDQPMWWSNNLIVCPCNGQPLLLRTRVTGYPCDMGQPPWPCTQVTPPDLKVASWAQVSVTPKCGEVKQTRSTLSRAACLAAQQQRRLLASGSHVFIDLNVLSGAVPFFSRGGLSLQNATKEIGQTLHGVYDNKDIYVRSY